MIVRLIQIAQLVVRNVRDIKITGSNPVLGIIDRLEICIELIKKDTYCKKIIRAENPVVDGSSPSFPAMFRGDNSIGRVRK